MAEGFRGGIVHIIVVSNRLAKAKSVSITPWHLAACAAATLAVVLAAACTLFWLSLRFADRLSVPQLESLLSAVQARETNKTESFVRENLDALAVKLGQMQAQLTRLDALGERVSSLAGLKPAEFRFAENPGRGGALAASSVPYSLSMDDLARQVDALSRQVETRTDQLGMLESALFDARMKRRLIPTVTPVEATWSASSFGWRIDPFNGQQAMHEGVDFIADVGTPIFAAAGGVVIFAAHHHQYGNMVEIDHGNDFITRYAHASKLTAKVGDLVQRGRKIAEVGSTGRSTGPHLHFEVRYKGVAQNPARFLRAGR
jgi:murein DD-endopeptidase MepM/ murein hydrolase activator NlpD